MQFIIRNNWFIGIAAGAQALGTFFVFDLVSSSSIAFSIFILLVTKAGYTFLRKLEDFNHPKHRKGLLISQLPFLVLALPCLYFSFPSVYQFCLILVACILLGLYANLFKSIGLEFNLRSRAIIKVVMITIVWLMMTVIFPLLSKINPKTIQFIVMQFLFIAMLTIPFDFRDAKSELEKGNETLPSKFGELTTRKICRGLAILSWITSGFFDLNVFYIMSVLIIIYLFFLKNISEQMSFEKYTLSFDGLLIIQAICLMVVYGVL